MERTQTVELSPQAFYDNLLLALQHEVAHYQNMSVEEVPREQLQPGFTYEVATKNDHYHVELCRLQPYELYETVVTSNRGQSHMRYEIAPGETPGTAQVTYREYTTSQDFLTKLNEKILGFLFKKKLNHHMQRKIEQIAQISQKNIQ